jgi:hypothetical protein
VQWSSKEILLNLVGLVLELLQQQSSIRIWDPLMLKLVNYWRKILYSKENKNEKYRKVYVMIIVCCVWLSNDKGHL